MEPDFGVPFLELFHDSKSMIVERPPKINPDLG